MVTELNPPAHSASLGIFIETGTRHEPPDLMGVSHFLEHLVFKGTKKRDSYELVRALEAVGGELNAYTTREFTCYHTNTLHEDVELAADILSDIVRNATFPKEEFERERSVVLQEIAQSGDDVEDSVQDMFLESYFKGSSLGFDTLGTEETIGKMRRKQVLDYYNRYYGAERMTVALSGRFDHDRVVQQLDSTLGRRGTQRRQKALPRPRPRRFARVIQRELEQVHFVLGFPTTSFKDRLRFEAFVLNALLGGGMTSKLYQRVREDRGLVYSIYSQLLTFTDCGLCLVYASTTPENLRKVMSLVIDELENLKERGLRPGELSLFRTQVRGALLLGSEEIEGRMTSLGVNEMVFRKYRPVQDVIREVEAVNEDTLARYLKQRYRPAQASVLLMGPVSEADRDWLSSRLRRPVEEEHWK